MTPVVTRRLWKSVIVTCAHSFIFGYCLSSLNTALKTGPSEDPDACYYTEDNDCPKGSLLRDVHLTAEGQEAAQAVLVAGAWLGSFAVNIPIERFGPRAVLLFLNWLFIAGSILSSLPNVVSLIIGRLLLGFGVGCEAACVPALLSEISPPDVKGKVVGTHQLSLNIGIAAAGIGGAVLAEVPHGWSYVQLFICAPALFQLIFHKYVPQSPHWLARHSRKDEAKHVLLWLRDHTYTHTDRHISNISAYDNRIYDSIEEELEGCDGRADREGSWKEVFSRRSMVITGVGVMCLTAMTGINSVIFYSTTVFEMAGIKQDTLATMLVSIVNVLATVLAQRLLDSKGRRTMLLFGQSLMGISLVFLAVSLLLLGKQPILQGITAVGCVFVYVSAFQLGLGTCGWVVAAEIVPAHLRSKAMSLFVSANWACNLFISSLTLTSINLLGGGVRGVSLLYLIFACVCAIGVLFAWYRIPCVVGKSKLQVEVDGAYLQLPSSSLSSGNGTIMECPEENEDCTSPLRNKNHTTDLNAKETKEISAEILSKNTSTSYLV